MNNNLTIIREFMANNEIEYLLINSTNEFLVEYNTLDENSRYKVTKFSGSTGDVLVAPDFVYLFVDGRYHIQADNEVNHNVVNVVKLTANQNQTDEIIKKIPQGKLLGIFSKKNSKQRIDKFAKHCQIKLFDDDPLDMEVLEDINADDIFLPAELTGQTTDDKIKEITKNLNENEYIYITDLDEVSYIFNCRNFSRNYSSKIIAKALISQTDAKLFKKSEMKNLEEFLKSTSATIYYDKKTINGYDFNIIKDKSKPLEKNIVQEMKSQKNQNELKHLAQAFQKSDAALTKTRDYIKSADKISEYDIAEFLEGQFKNQGAKCLSFKSIVARNANSALAHYSKSSKDEIIKDGDLVLIDCGAYFEGGLATDMTRVFVKGEPTELHKKIYTHVLRAFLLAFNYVQSCGKSEITGFEIDDAVHKYFDSQKLDGFVFNHGLGHGIGVNVHEYPPKLSTHEISKVQIKNGMCFSIEPGLYKESCFGVRLENSCYFENGKIISFSNMCFEEKLIDYAMLTDIEKQQLAKFKVK